MKKRKLAALLTALAMAVSLTACGGGSSSSQPAVSQPAAESKAAEAGESKAAEGQEDKAQPSGDPAAEAGKVMSAEDFGNVWELIDRQDISGFKIGLMSSSVAQGEETYRMAMRMQDKFGDRLIVDTFPEKAVSEQETTISKVMAMASDPEVKAIVFNQAQDGTIAAIKKLKEVREDVLTIACNPNEDYDEIATVADFVLCKDQFGFAEQVANMAIEMGAKSFVHYSFPRHMSNQNIAKRCEMIKEICEGAEIQFLEVTAPDPQGDAGTAGTQQFILEDVPRQLKALGEDTVFFSTNTAMHSPIVKCVMEGHGMYCGQSDPTPFADFPSALGLEVPEDKIGDSDYMLAEIQKKIDELGMNGRVSTWPTSLNMMYTQIGIMYGMLYSSGVIGSVEGEEALNALTACTRTLAGDNAQVNFWTNADGKEYSHVFRILGGQHVFE